MPILSRFLSRAAYQLGYGAASVGVPAARRLLSLAASLLLRLLFPTPGVRDFTCGYRAYRASALRRRM